MSRKSKAVEFAEMGLNITVTGRHVEVTESMQDYAIDKISKIERFGYRLLDVLVTMDIQRYEQRVDIIVKLDHTRIKSHAITEDMYASIDKAVDRLQTQIRRYKNRLHDHQAQKPSSVELPVEVIEAVDDEDLADLNAQIDKENYLQVKQRFQPHRIVSKHTKSLHLLSNDEAVVRMELSGDAFLLFRSEEDRQIHVIYRRDDGNYGVISLAGQ